jgi:hypothetical protein
LLAEEEPVASAFLDQRVEMAEMALTEFVRYTAEAVVEEVEVQEFQPEETAVEEAGMVEAEVVARLA